MMKRTIGFDYEDIFMKKFKYYKSNNPKPKFDDVLNLDSNYSPTQDITRYINTTKSDKRVEMLGLRNPSEWDILSFKKHPGLIFIRNPFTSLGQRHWIRKCLEEYPKKPNKTNIDIERCILDWWLECYKTGQCDTKLQNKMRWATLGYHHNWDTKVYCEDNRNKFPDDLEELCDVVSTVLNFDNFRAEAAIVNYYHMSSTLSAHTDHSEINLEAPLFSFSFGQSAIFLIGGQDKLTEPSAVMLNSGDIVVMSKEARLCYHAVPKIVSSLTQPWNDSNSLRPVAGNKSILKFANMDMIISEINRNIDNAGWSDFCKYVEHSRININIRQVLNENQKSLNF